MGWQHGLLLEAERHRPQLVADPAHRDGLSLAGVLRIDNEAAFFKGQELWLCRGGSQPLDTWWQGLQWLKGTLLLPSSARRSAESRDMTDPTGGQHEGLSGLPKRRRRPITYTGLGGCIAQGLNGVLAALAHGDGPELAHSDLHVPARQRGREDMH